jgi:hypothetical protein
VTENANQLGTAVITAGSGVTITPSANAITIGVVGGVPITQIDGDVGSVAGSTVSFHGIASGSSVIFSGTISTMLLEVTDANLNTIIGNNAGNGSLTGTHNTSLGYSSLSALTSGGLNTAIGYQAGSTITSGSGNIYLGNITGATATEADTTRIGNTGVTAACYILGIGGVDVASTANVVVESSDQLGTAVISGGTNISVTSGANIITISSSTTVTSHYVTVTHAASPYTALSTDYYISCDVTAGVITILLPNAPTTGRVFVIKDKFGLCSSNNITITTVGGTVGIDGVTSFVMNTAYEAVQVIFNSTNYEVF